MNGVWLNSFSLHLRLFSDCSVFLRNNLIVLNLVVAFVKAKRQF